MKLTTPEQKIIELAKMDGFDDCLIPTQSNSRYMVKIRGKTDWMLGKDYLASYDAIIPLIQEQNSETQLQICRFICNNYKPNPNEDYLTGWMRLVFALTPAELANALLRAKGFEV